MLSVCWRVGPRVPFPTRADLSALPPEALDRARTAYGTDEDLLIVEAEPGPPSQEVGCVPCVCVCTLACASCVCVCVCVCVCAGRRVRACGGMGASERGPC
jgi:hypothetical protein